MLADAPLGRSHRAAVGKSKLAEAIELTRDVLNVPADYRIGIVPGSDTGAVETHCTCIACDTGAVGSISSSDTCIVGAYSTCSTSDSCIGGG